MIKLGLFLALCWFVYISYKKIVTVKDCSVCGYKPVKTGYLKPVVSCSNKDCPLHNIEMSMNDWTRMTQTDTKEKETTK